MEGFQPTPVECTRGGPSPNPTGRLKGIVDKRQNAFADDAVAIAMVVIAKARRLCRSGAGSHPAEVKGTDPR